MGSTSCRRTIQMTASFSWNIKRLGNLLPHTAGVSLGHLALLLSRAQADKGRASISTYQCKIRLMNELVVASSSQLRGFGPLFGPAFLLGIKMTLYGAIADGAHACWVILWLLASRFSSV